MTQDDTFTCGFCGEVFDNGWTDEESEAEARQVWSEEERKGEMDLACDDCFAKLMAAIGREIPA